MHFECKFPAASTMTCRALWGVPPCCFVMTYYALWVPLLCCFHNEVVVATILARCPGCHVEMAKPIAHTLRRLGSTPSRLKFRRVHFNQVDYPCKLIRLIRARWWGVLQLWLPFVIRVPIASACRNSEYWWWSVLDRLLMWLSRTNSDSNFGLDRHALSVPSSAHKLVSIHLQIQPKYCGWNPLHSNFLSLLGHRSMTDFHLWVAVPSASFPARATCTKDQENLKRGLPFAHKNTSIPARKGQWKFQISLSSLVPLA